MARVKRAVNGKKHRRAVLEQAQGYYGNRSRSFRSANEAVMHSLQYAYRDRRARKGDFRRLWIQRINAAARANGTSYSRLIAGLREAEVDVDRKVLADLAVTDPERLRPPGARWRRPPWPTTPAPARRVGGGRPGTAPDHRARPSGTSGSSACAGCCAGAACAARRGPSSSKGSSSSPAPSTPAPRSRPCSSTTGPRAGPDGGRRRSSGPASRGARVFELAPGVLERVADTVTPQPVLAVVRMPAATPRRPGRAPPSSSCASTCATRATPAR